MNPEGASRLSQNTMLKPSLQLKLGQQLTMTPQLQQAIRLLQLPALELQAHIRELLESNVMLGATEATYERLALILFGSDLPQLLGKPLVPAAAPTMSAEERLELQREKARIRARLRRATIKAARQAG